MMVKRSATFRRGRRKQWGRPGRGAGGLRGDYIDGAVPTPPCIALQILFNKVFIRFFFSSNLIIVAILQLWDTLRRVTHLLGFWFSQRSVESSVLVCEVVKTECALSHTIPSFELVLRESPYHHYYSW